MAYKATINILVVAPQKAGFIERDDRIIWRVERIYARNPVAITLAARRAKRVVVWFLAQHAFYAIRAAKSRGIPTLLILGGQEGAACRECKYGLWLRPWHVRQMARYALWNASEVWAVEPSLAFRTLAYAGMSPRSRPVDVVPTVFDPDEFRPFERVRERDVVYGWVAPAPRKGVGIIKAALMGSGLSSVPIGQFSQTYYAQVLRTSKVVVNASHHEGLNNTLCEAMLSGCIPVVSDIPGNRWAVDGAPGYVVPYGDVEALRGAMLDAAAAWNEDVAARVRAHVIRRFPMAERRAAFRRWVEGTA